jgi:hypothetical protein
MNILEQANNIVNKRTEEKDRNYGPFSEGMNRAAMIFNGMTGLNITGNEMFKALVALKLSRESYNHREDNLLDACAYLGALNNYIDEEEPKQTNVIPDGKNLTYNTHPCNCKK